MGQSQSQLTLEETPDNNWSNSFEGIDSEQTSSSNKNEYSITKSSLNENSFVNSTQIQSNHVQTIESEESFSKVKITSTSTTEPTFDEMGSSKNVQSDSFDSSDSSNSLPDSPFDPETGVINWDCPCLKGALDPPCGEFFKAAFSCFVSSKSEPRGEDCIDKFIALQECFRKYPEIYDKKFSESQQKDFEMDEE